MNERKALDAIGQLDMSLFDTPDELSEKITALQDCAGLTVWENEFLYDLSIRVGQDHGVTMKQRACLLEMYAKKGLA